MGVPLDLSAGPEGRLPGCDTRAGSEGVASLPPEADAPAQVKSIIPKEQSRSRLRTSCVSGEWGLSGFGTKPYPRY